MPIKNRPDVRPQVPRAEALEVRGPAKTAVPAGPPRVPVSDAEFDQFEAAGGPAELPADAAPATHRAAELTWLSEHKLAIAGASGVVALSDKQFLVIDDDKGVYLAKPDGKAKGVAKTKDHKMLEDLEGICRSPDGEHAFVLSERTGMVFQLEIEEGKKGKLKLGDPQPLGSLPDIDRVRNKGWEGMDLMPGELFADGKARLAAVHEGHPRKIGIFTLPGLETDVMLKLPKNAKGEAYDLSDIAVDPHTGHLFVLSDESATVLEMALVRETTTAPGALLDNTHLELLGVTQLEIGRSEKPEGLDFGPDGKLWVAMDGKARLYSYHVDRPD